MSRILIAEDDRGIADFIDRGLRAAGYACDVVDTGALAFEMARSGDYDLMVLDLGLPHMDGADVLEQLRALRVTLPIIVLTARTKLADRIRSLEGGADDYMPKPFSFEELLARIRLRLRAESPQGGGAQSVTQLSHNGLVLDFRTRKAQVDGEWIDLSAREFTLAETFLRNPGQVLSREQLLSNVWGFDFDPGSNVVDVYVRYLRGKLGRDRFETVRGMGYRLV